MSHYGQGGVDMMTLNTFGRVMLARPPPHRHLTKLLDAQILNIHLFVFTDNHDLFIFTRLSWTR